MTYSGELKAQKLSDLYNLVESQILRMPKGSIIWTPGFTADQIRRMAAMVVGMEVSRDSFRIDKVEFNGGRIVLGKGITDAIGFTYPNDERGEGVIICPHCFEADETEKGTVLRKHNVIYTGHGLGVMYKTVDADTDDIYGGFQLSLSCNSPGGCKTNIFLQPNIPASLGKYGGVDTNRYI